MKLQEELNNRPRRRPRISHFPEAALRAIGQRILRNYSRKSEDRRDDFLPDSLNGRERVVGALVDSRYFLGESGTSGGRIDQLENVRAISSLTNCDPLLFATQYGGEMR